MNRTVPPLLQTHLDSGSTTVCVLLKITPRHEGATPLALTSLNRDVTYNDGGGALTYAAAIGVEMSNAESTSGMGIDNAEGAGLVDAMAEFDLQATEEELSSGLYDFAQWVRYLVNYEDLSMGHVELGRGEIGQVRVLDNGQRFTFETLGLTQPLKQSIVEKDSLRCRARFGSQPIGTVGAEFTERYPCGKDTSAMWVDGEVTNAGADPSFSFDTDLAAADDTYRPGMIRWLTGRNTGRSYEVEAYASGVVTVMFPLMFAAEVGDTFKIRRDCTKGREGANSCEDHFGADWVLHYRGEPWIPVGEQDQINIPGANG